jgi:hypothetical protein
VRGEGMKQHWRRSLMEDAAAHWKLRSMTCPPEGPDSIEVSYFE